MSMTRVTASKMTPNEMIALLLAQNADIIRLTEERDAARTELANVEEDRDILVQYVQQIAQEGR